MSFSFREGEHNRNWRRWYGYVIVEETSQAADDVLFTMLSFIAYSTYPDDRKWLKTAFCDYPNQLPPHIETQHPAP